MKTRAILYILITAIILLMGFSVYSYFNTWKELNIKIQTLRKAEKFDSIAEMRLEMRKKPSKTKEDFANIPSEVEISQQEKFEMESRIITLYVKIGLSFLFTVASLYVILSNKYDNQTKKWAYSVLTLIAGVWIGTSTS